MSNTNIVELPYIEGVPDSVFLSSLDAHQLSALSKVLGKPVEWRKHRATYEPVEELCIHKGCFRVANHEGAHDHG